MSTLYWATGTLENLPNGTHTIDVYALTAEGETHKSGTRTFMVNAISSSNSEQSFAASLIFVASVGIALAAIGLFVYFKKRKH